MDESNIKAGRKNQPTEDTLPLISNGFP